MTAAESGDAPGKTGPLFTIAIPTYNRAAWLKSCIDSALAQTYVDFEVVVSDNASTDGTAELLAQIDDPRLRVVRHPHNIGLIPNFNAGLKAARGRYTVVLPDDDRLLPHFLQKCADLIAGRQDISVVIAVGDVYLASDHRTLPAAASANLSTGVRDGAEILKEYLKGHLSVHLCTVVLRTGGLLAAGGFAEQYPFTGDIATWVPFLLRGDAGLINESCGIYTLHPATQTSRFNIDFRIQDIQGIVALIGRILDRSPADSRAAAALRRCSRGYFATHAFGIIASRRRLGTHLTELLPVLWKWRKGLLAGAPYVGLRNVPALAKSAALLAMPLPVARAVRTRLRRSRQRP